MKRVGKKKKWVQIIDGKKPRIIPGRRRPKGRLPGLVHVTDEQFAELKRRPEHTWRLSDGKVVSQSVFVRRWEWFVGGAALIGMIGTAIGFFYV